MDWSFVFFFNSALLGVGLAMDAFSVSLANGLNEPKMKKGRMCKIAAVFSVFQAAMPMIGWVCVHTVLQYFHHRTTTMTRCGHHHFLRHRLLHVKAASEERATCAKYEFGRYEWIFSRAVRR